MRNFRLMGELFPSTLLKTTAEAPFLVRPLRHDDHLKGYAAVLAQLTTVGDLDETRFAGRFRAMQETNRRLGTYYCIVVEHVPSRRLVGCATLLVEQKFIRETALCGHVEDVVTDKSVRGKGVGRLLTEALLRLAKEVGCYKVILDCDEKNVAFYERCGMTAKERQMVIYFPKQTSKL